MSIALHKVSFKSGAFLKDVYCSCVLLSARVDDLKSALLQLECTHRHTHVKAGNRAAPVTPDPWLYKLQVPLAISRYILPVMPVHFM